MSMQLLLVLALVTAGSPGEGQRAPGHHGESLPQPKGTIRLRERLRREVVCPKSEYRPPGRGYCCNECPAGSYKMADCVGPNMRTNCTPCRPGTFTAFPNHVPRCWSCQSCDPVLGQVELKPCQAHVNSECGCPSGMFQIRIDSKTFYCRNCTLCPTGIYRECSGYNDTVCHCERGQYYSKWKTCQPCEDCDPKRESCQLCNYIQESGSLTPGLVPLTAFAFSGLGLMTVVVLGYLVWKTWKKRSPSSPVISSQSDRSKSETLPGLDVTLLPVQEVSRSVDSPCYSGRVPELPDCVQIAGSTQLPNNSEVNYLIADLVPACRWREFMRRLGIHDRDIERSELDNRHAFREAQYAMLQAWRLRLGAHRATTEAICRVLKDMDLNACVEQLQEALH